jgi:Arc/MetJ family transcription regulator
MHSSLSLLVLLCSNAIAHAYSLRDLEQAGPEVHRLALIHKRALDSLDGAGFGLVKKRALDSLEGAGFGLNKRALDAMDGGGFGFDKRALDVMEGGGFGFDKRALDSMDGQGFGGFVRKRALDVLDSDGFGFNKRALDALDGADFGGLRKRKLAFATISRNELRKRALDALEGRGFGMLKRSADNRTTSRSIIDIDDDRLKQFVQTINRNRLRALREQVDLALRHRFPSKRALDALEGNSFGF